MDIEKRIDEYLKWLKQEIRFSPLSNGYYELVTPFLDSSNDYIQFYVKEENGHLFFTDDSWTLNTLEMSGIKLSEKRMSQIEQIAAQFGVRLDKSELTYKTNAKNLAKCSSPKQCSGSGICISHHKAKYRPIFMRMWMIFSGKKKSLLQRMSHLPANPVIRIPLTICGAELRLIRNEFAM